MLLDRDGERAALDGLLGDVRSGRGRTLVVRGEAGVGKSALLEYMTGAAADTMAAQEYYDFLEAGWEKTQNMLKGHM